MSITKFKDGKGVVIEVYQHGDIILPKWPVFKDAADMKDSMEALKELKAREDDILLCSYPKSGCHWLWEVIGMVQRGKAEYAKDIKVVSFMEMHKVSQLDELPSPRIFNTHLPFECIPEDLKKRKCKIVFVQRNPKDVAVSTFNHMSKEISFNYNGSWSDFFPVFLGDINIYDSWWKYTLNWERCISEFPDLPILSLTYEEMKKDPIKGTKAVAEFLGVTIGDNVIEDIASKCNFENLQKANEEIKDDKSKFLSKDGKNFIFRKGQVGDWKNWFTVAQNEEFDAVYAEKMKDSKLKFVYQLD